MRELKKAVSELEEIKLEEKFLEKRSSLIAKMNQHLCQWDFSYRETFYVQQAADEIKTTIMEMEAEFSKEESEAFRLSLTDCSRRLRDLSVKLGSDEFFYTQAKAVLDSHRASPVDDKFVLQVGDEKARTCLQSLNKMFTLWVRLLVNRSKGECFTPPTSDYSLTERCFNLSMFFSEYPLVNLKTMEIALSTRYYQHEQVIPKFYSLFSWLLRAVNCDWLQNAPLLGIYLLRHEAEGGFLSYLLGRCMDFPSAPNVETIVRQIAREKNIRLSEVTRDQICDIFNLEEVVNSKTLITELEKHIPKDLGNIVSKYYNTGFFKPCTTPKNYVVSSEILQPS